jgi:3-oxoacyl-[acyl-carrier-protein] synthase II
VVGTTASGILELEDALEEVGSIEGLPSHALLGFEKTDVAETLATELGLFGPRQTVSTACASGATAILLGAELIRRGEADAALAGGTDALARMTLLGFRALRALDPGAARPYDATRRGLTLGEGAGMVVLERADLARARGASILGELLGGAQTTDAHHVTAPIENGSGAARAIREALRRARVSPDRVDHVNGHGTGTRPNDAAEAAASARPAGSCPGVTEGSARAHAQRGRRDQGRSDAPEPRDRSRSADRRAPEHGCSASTSSGSGATSGAAHRASIRLRRANAVLCLGRAEP